MNSFLIFLFSIILIFVFSKNVINELYLFIHRITKSKTITVYFLALLYAPGTILHEMSHFFSAAGLLLPVRSIDLVPEVTEQGIKMGSVSYVRKDFFRGLLVGIAPFFAGLFFFYVVASVELDTMSVWFRIIVAYLMFVISASMFSSPQDLVDLVFIIPFILIILLLLYIFQIDTTGFFVTIVGSSFFISFFEKINTFLILSGIINVIAFILLTTANRLRT